ncbi:MAG: type IV toxin-antitoxin system AbiEi family antitoxin [Coriobacteriia bacterium]
MQEREIIDEALSQLHRLIPDTELHLQQPSGRYRLAPDFVLSLRLDSLEMLLLGEVFRGEGSSVLRDRIERLQVVMEEAADSVPLVVAPFLSPRRREMIREAGLCYLDLSGNAYIRHRSLYVSAEGQPNAFPRESGSRGPFVGKGSLVSEVLLEQPRPWGIRELAAEAGLDPGHVSRVVRELLNGGYASKDSGGRVQARKPEDLLNDWADAYKPPKGESLLRFAQVRRIGDVLGNLRECRLDSGVRYALASQAGASIIAPYAALDRIDLYVGDADSQQEIEKCLELRPVDRGANVVMHLLSDADDPSIRRRRFVDGLWVASDVRLYLDLRKYPRRGLEQAEHLLEQIMRPRWERQ